MRTTKDSVLVVMHDATIDRTTNGTGRVNELDYSALQQFKMVYAAIQAGVHVWPDIQSPDEAGNWDKAIALGVEGLQTDHPAELIAYLKKKKLR